MLSYLISTVAVYGADRSDLRDLLSGEIYSLVGVVCDIGTLDSPGQTLLDSF